MIDDYTTLEQSKRLAALGFVGQWPQMVWARWPYKDRSPHRLEHWPAKSLDFKGWLGSWYPAPVLYRVLEWLREQYGWYWSYSYDNWHAESAEPFTEPVNASSPSDLIDAIMDKVEAPHD